MGIRWALSLWLPADLAVNRREAWGPSEHLKVLMSNPSRSSGRRSSGQPPFPGAGAHYKALTSYEWAQTDFFTISVRLHLQTHPVGCLKQP